MQPVLCHQLFEVLPFDHSLLWYNVLNYVHLKIDPTLDILHCINAMYTFSHLYIQCLLRVEIIDIMSFVFADL